MLRRLFFAIIMILLTVGIYAQSPESFKYQAVARDGTGQVLMDQSVSFQISILQGGTTGTSVYSETHNVTTNTFGLVNLAVGDGTVVSGDFTNIAWGTDDYFVKIEMDATGGTDYQVLGTSQLLSVPYALYSKTAGSVPGDNDTDNTNEIQNITLSGTNLSISDGNTVNLSPLQDGVTDADADPSNEIQTLALAGNTLSLSSANNVDLSNIGMPSLWNASGQNIYYDAGDVGINTDSPEFDFHVNGELFVNSSFGRINLGFPSNGNQWRMSTQGSGANLQFQSKPSGSSTYTRRLYLDGSTGNVAIGNNDNPDEELVVGSNLGTSWNITAATVAGSLGGVIQVGSPDYKISMLSGSIENRAQIISYSPAGAGEGEIEMQTDGLAIGEDVGSPGSYMLKVEHGSFGFNLVREGTTNDWEFLTSSAAASNLNLYANGAFRGSFSGTDGSWNPSSDRSLKTDVKPLENVLSDLMQLKPARYKYIHNNPKNAESVGFIAQEVKALFPEMVLVVEDERSNGLHAMNYAGMSVLAIKAIQEQEEKIRSQASIIEGQQNEIENLKARLDKIEAMLNK